jgi:hypothetical protein
MLVVASRMSNPISSLDDDAGLLRVGLAAKPIANTARGIQIDTSYHPPQEAWYAC